ncbi:GAF domain-containing protein [Myxococcaceae bacterium GXIMD 01537]
MTSSSDAPPRYALIAEPDPQRSSEYVALLAGLGLDTAIARDGVEAREFLRRRGAPALLILELVLPRLDGFALLGELRALPAPVTTAVVVVTAFDEVRLLAWPQRARLGIHAFHTRSTPLDTLRRVFRDALDGRLGGSEPSTTAPRSLPSPAAPQGAPGADAELKDTVAAVAEAFGAPVALLALEDGDSRHSVAHVALPRVGPAESRDWSRFHRAVPGLDGLVIPDAAKHAELREEPLVQDGILGSYAGAALVTPDGRRLGTLCILDPRRRAFGREELGVLVGLARRIAGEVESRDRARATAREAARLRDELQGKSDGTEALGYLREALHAVDAGVLLVDAEGRTLVANERLADLLGVGAKELASMSLDAVRQHLAGLSTDPKELLLRLGPPSRPSVTTLAVTLELERPRPRVVRWTARPIALPGGHGQLSTFTEVSREASDAARPPAVAVAS